MMWFILVVCVLIHIAVAEFGNTKVNQVEGTARRLQSIVDSAVLWQTQLYPANKFSNTEEVTLTVEVVYRRLPADTADMDFGIGLTDGTQFYLALKGDKHRAWLSETPAGEYFELKGEVAFKSTPVQRFNFTIKYPQNGLGIAEISDGSTELGRFQNIKRFDFSKEIKVYLSNQEADEISLIETISVCQSAERQTYTGEDMDSIIPCGDPVCEANWTLGCVNQVSDFGGAVRPSDVYGGAICQMKMHTYVMLQSGSCRLQNGSKGMHTVVSTVTLSDCKAQCDLDVGCAGIEYNSSAGDCELHSQAPHHGSGNGSSSCYRKTSWDNYGALQLIPPPNARQTWQIEMHGYQYFLGDPTRINYFEAKSVCENMGSDLLWFDSKDEFFWFISNWKSIIARYYSKTFIDVWIGCTDSAKEGNFVRDSDGSECLTFWGPGAPNNQNNEDYVHLRYFLKMNDVSPTSKWAVACKRIVPGVRKVVLQTVNINNTGTCKAEIDYQKLDAHCANQTLELNSMGSGTLLGNDVNSNSTGGGVLTVTPANFTCADVGTHTVTLTTVGRSGHSDTCTSTVTVVDTTAPLAKCKAATITLNAEGTGSVTPDMVNNESSDSCGIASLSITPSLFTCANMGDNAVTLTVTDNNGNPSACNSIVTVEDFVIPACSSSTTTTSSTTGTVTTTSKTSSTETSSTTTTVSTTTTTTTATTTTTTTTTITTSSPTATTSSTSTTLTSSFTTATSTTNSGTNVIVTLMDSTAGHSHLTMTTTLATLANPDDKSSNDNITIVVPAVLIALLLCGELVYILGVCRKRSTATEIEMKSETTNQMFQAHNHETDTSEELYAVASNANLDTTDVEDGLQYAEASDLQHTYEETYEDQFGFSSLDTEAAYETPLPGTGEKEPDLFV
eukprot:m.305002 g.305002  ORF g.305002 m.305002 type:complete len:899 (+) comp16444_c0_seq2:182-2878(+)